jgi:HCOMODA/2-hydroxy-3-carboxy-muconic semialdehyde decarboxylase
MEFDLDGNAVDARGRTVFLERFIHGEIYKARPDVMGVVHTHSPGVFSVTKVPLRAMFHNPSFLAAGVPVWDIRKDFGETNMLVSDAALGARRQIGGADARPRRRDRRAVREDGRISRLLHRRQRQAAVASHRAWR